MIIIDIIKYTIWWNNPEHIKEVQEIEYLYSNKVKFIGYRELLIDLNKYKGPKQIFVPMLITCLHYSLAKKNVCHFWMGRKWCYCKADIFEKLMDENDCPLGGDYDIEKISQHKSISGHVHSRRVVSFRTDVDIFANPTGKASNLKITYDES